MPTRSRVPGGAGPVKGAARKPAHVTAASQSKRGGDGELSKSAQAYEAIRGHIADGTYGSGYRLVLDQLAAEYNMSTVPVREAIRRWEAEGYIVFKRNVGAQVAAINPKEYAQVMQVLGILEASATALAIPYLQSEDLERVRACNMFMRESLAAFDPLAFTRSNREFHTTLFSRCPNEHLLTFIKREWERLDVIRRSTFAFVPARAHDAVKEHDRLLEMIESSAEPTEIEWFVREHRLATAQAFQLWDQEHHQRSGSEIVIGGHET